jgi:murein DD-endopeptidase MepM/ murein hydrolase activator NlpD
VPQHHSTVAASPVTHVPATPVAAPLPSPSYNPAPVSDPMQTVPHPTQSAPAAAPAPAAPAPAAAPAAATNANGWPADLCYPVSRASFKRRANDFGSGRPVSGARKNKRCHCGNDLILNPPGAIVAVDAGEVTKIIPAFLDCSDGFAGPGRAGSVLVYHPRLDMTINYGEIDSEQITLKKGDSVQKGMALGRGGHCGVGGNTGMLHFEVYKGRVERSYRWWTSAPCRDYKCATGPATSKNWCATNALATKPSKLLDPADLLQHLSGKFCS